jgi:NAD(P)-dependent dehydrogenase (short-subunit alcohol dehydrogenase family)
MSLPSFSLEGRAAIVTGGSRGIGKALALTFAEAGADVVVSSRNLDGSLEAVAEEIRGLGRRSLAVKADTTKKADVDNLVQATLNEFAAIDIMVNNAGQLLVVPFTDQSEEDWDRIMDANVKGYFLCSQAVAKIMIDQKKGNIINISSVKGIEAGRDRACYCTSKAGIIMLTKVLALELAKHNIRVNSIAPGWIKTKINEHIWRDPASRKKIEAGIPLGYLAEPSDLVGTALFLASDASNYITGQTIVVDGGFIL